MRKAKDRQAARSRRAEPFKERYRLGNQNARRYRDLVERLHANSYVDPSVGIWIKREGCEPEWSPCWLWLGDKDSGGYGRICIRTKRGPRNRQAHRVSFFEHKGLPFKKRKPLLMHQCDRASCIHPDHVDPGTHRLNMREMVERGRHGNRWGNVSNGYGKLAPVVEEATVEHEPGSDG